MNHHRFAVIYTVFLFILSAFVLLDTFVIPHAERSALDGNVSTGRTSFQIVVPTPNLGETDTDTPEISEPEETASPTQEAIITETSYRDANIQISITTERLYDTDIYIADVQLRELAYLKTAFAKATYGRNIKATTSVIAESVDAIFAVNGDYYGFRNEGFVLRNGVIYRESSYGNEALAILSDGSFLMANENSVALSALWDAGAWQVFSFGPALTRDAALAVSEETRVRRERENNPRTAIGMIEPLHYIFVVCDGRTKKSKGLTIYQLAAFMLEKGCVAAYNLDGGGSSTMWFNGKVLNVPVDSGVNSERSVSDIVYIGY